MDIWSRLEQEWVHASTGAAARRHLRAWAAIVPMLGGFDSPAEVVAAIGRMGDPRRSCSLLGDLLVVAHGDKLAVLAVLRAVGPGVRGAAWRRWRVGRDDGPWRDREEVDADAVAAAWEAIRVHAGERHARPAGVIVRRVERRLRSSHDAHRRLMARTVSLASEPAAARLDGLGEDTSDQGVADSIVAAVRAGCLDRPSAALLFAVAVLGWTAADAAGRLGLDRRAAHRSLVVARRVLDGERRPPPRRAERRRRLPTPSFTLSKEDFPMLPLLMTVKEAADLLGVGRTTMYDLMDTGEVFSLHRGASRRVPLWAGYDYLDRLCDGRFHRVPLQAVVDHLVRLTGGQDGTDLDVGLDFETDGSRHRSLLQSAGDDRPVGGAVVESSPQQHAGDGSRHPVVAPVRRQA